MSLNRSRRNCGFSFEILKVKKKRNKYEDKSVAILKEISKHTAKSSYNKIPLEMFRV